MKRTIFLIFLCTAFEGDIGRHIYIPIPMTWLDAQSYCVHNYTDLSFVSSQKDSDILLRMSSGDGWIGLYRDPKNKTAWMWSGGGHISYQNWGPGQPDNYMDSEDYGEMLADGQWNDAFETVLMPFYCISIIALGPKTTWEGAQTDCIKRESNLTSLISETDHVLTQRVLQESYIERVWIGLRFLQDNWLWVNGEPLVYQAWIPRGDQDHQCPIWKRCGVLTKGGHWESRDCNEKLNFICH